MKIGFLGLPGSGKTTLFNLVTGRETDPSKLGRAEARLAVVKVPDPRLNRLAEIFHSAKIIEPEIVFVDLLALHRAEDAHPRDDSLTKVAGDADAFALVIQCFGELDHQGNPLDPVADLEALLLELTIADLGIVERRLERLEAELKSARDKTSTERDLLRRVEAHLSAGGLVRDLELRESEEVLLRGFHLFTAKPLLVVCNVAEDDPKGVACAPVAAFAETRGLNTIAIAATLEQEIARLDVDSRAEFLADYGIEEPARDRFIRACYRLLDLITFFTGDRPEAHGWTITAGSTAREAAGKIHTDFYKGFIRAEVVPFAKLDELGTLAACKEAGVMRMEGRDYVVEDGDYMLVHFSR
jgi:GTP-binding protein YchF